MDAFFGAFFGAAAAAAADNATANAYANADEESLLLLLPVILYHKS